MPEFTVIMYLPNVYASVTTHYYLIKHFHLFRVAGSSWCDVTAAQCGHVSGTITD